MSGKLKDYQVLDVLCGGTFYKVRHKVTDNIFAWKAYDCSAYSREQIQNVVNEVKTISAVVCESLLRYHETILHGPSKTLYVVLEYNTWQTLERLVAECEATDKYIAESFIWRLLLELARVCKVVEGLSVVVLRRCISAAQILVGERCQLRVNCFELGPDAGGTDIMRQVGSVVRALCCRPGDKINELRYSDDLRDVIDFLTDDKNSNLRPDVVLYHPTVLANLDSTSAPKRLSDILLSLHDSLHISEVNKCDSEKAVMCRAIEPMPRTRVNLDNSPIYCNISPKRKWNREIEESKSARGSLSPTLAALALELPGFVPRSRKPLSQAMQTYKPQSVSEDTLSQQWMSRLVALRQREESLNQRERDLIKKEIVNSPATKIIPLIDSPDDSASGSNGITLPAMMVAAETRRDVTRRRRRAGSVRARRKTFGYENLDSSLSADPGDSSMVITAARITKDNMPRRNIFPDISTKKVHFTSANPFVESDESVTLTFYELENVDGEGYQVPRQEEKAIKDITKFKYLDLEKLTSEKRAAMQWSHSSPSKQAKMSKKIFSDITNTGESLRKTPSKSSLMSRGSDSSRCSMMSARSQLSMESGKASEGNISERTRANARQTLTQTPVAPPEVKKSKRKSLLPFKTPFKFMTSTKI